MGDTWPPEEGEHNRPPMSCVRCEPLGLYVEGMVQLRGDWLCEGCFCEALREVRDMADDLIDAIESQMTFPYSERAPRGTPAPLYVTFTPECLN